MHANNFGRMIEEQIEFNDTIKFVLDYINSPDSKATLANTLIIVTADHDHLLFGPEGATVPFQPVQPDRNGDGVPECQWFSDNHSNQIVPLYAIGAEANAVGALADKVDAVIGTSGERLAGSQRLYTDQADLGDFLLEELDAGATPVKIDWDALAAQVFAEFCRHRDLVPVRRVFCGRAAPATTGSLPGPRACNSVPARLEGGQGSAGVDIAGAGAGGRGAGRHAGGAGLPAAGQRGRRAAGRTDGRAFPAPRQRRGGTE